MKSEIKETSRLPGFILILFAIQLIVFLFLFIKNKKSDLEIFYVLVPISLILIFLKMSIVVGSTSFKYKLFPFHFNYKKIDWNDINEVHISKISALSDFLGWGLRYSRKFGWAYIFNSDDVILFQLKNGKKMAVTIKDKNAIIRFLTENQISFKTD